MTQPDARAEAERWLAQAENDLSFAEHGLRLGFHAQACFLAQQVAEKALKAAHYLRGARVVLGHSVDALLEVLETAEPGAAALRDGAKELDQHYVPARYPNSLPGNAPFRVYTAEQARRALGHARAIVDFVGHRVRAAPQR
jgi:HEPN domain-containing protein